MFLHYYVDTRPHHKHSVHHEGCANMPPIEFRQYLGMFESIGQATAMAKVVYDRATQCSHCAKIHTKRTIRMRPHNK